MNDEKKPKYKLRKLSIGVVSFMCGFTILFGSFANVNAQVPASSTVKVIDKSNWPSMIADKSNEGKPLKPGTGFYGGDSNDEVGYTETVQPLGGWTDVNFEELPDNLGTQPAPNQGGGKMIEYSATDWEGANNKEVFGWKPINGGKIAFSKEGLNAIGTRPSGLLQYQDGFVGATVNNSSSDSNNLLILANYADQGTFKGVSREVEVNGEREIGFKSIVSGLGMLLSGDAVKVRFVNADTDTEISNHIIYTSQTSSVNRVVMLPKETRRVRVELIPMYNQQGIVPYLGRYPGAKYNSYVSKFELFRGSKMQDALPETEKIQIFKNNEKGTYKFTVKDDGEGQGGTGGRLSVAPYYGNQNDPQNKKLNASVDLNFEDKIENEAVLIDKADISNPKVVSDLKPSLYDNGLNTIDSKVEAGSTKELSLKNIDLTKKNFARPTEIFVTDYKLNYGTRNYSLNSDKVVNPYINRVDTVKDTPYRQDVVANSDEAANKYGNNVTSKLVSDNATGRKIIILMDKTALTEVVNAEKAKTLNQADYTNEAWEKYQEALAKAKAILAEDESLDNLSVDTANKLSRMANQRTITELAETLPTILVKAPILEEQKNGDIKATPAENTVKMTVNYKDGDKNISVEITKQENPKQQESDPTTYSWNITNVATIEGSNPTVNNTNTPTGVSLNSDTGVITIEKAHINGGTNVTATDVNASNAESKESSITVFTPATFTSTPVSYVAGSGEAGSITGGVTTTETGLTDVTKEIVEVDGQKTSEVPQTAGEHTVKVKVTYTKDGVTTSTVETVTVNVSPSTVESNASYFTNATDKSEIVKKAFEDANNGITINGNITVTKVDGQTASELPSTVKAEGDGTYTVTATATIVKDGASYPNQEITVKVKVVSPATFTSTPVSYVAGSGEAGSITGGVTTTETGLTGVTKEIVEVDGQKTSEVPQTAGEHTVKVKVTYTKDGVTTSTVETVTVNVSPSTVEGNASYFTNATDKSEIVKKAFEDANNGITINGNITVTKVDGQTASELPSTVKAEGDGTYTVTATATIVKDGASYPNQEITVKVKVVSPATFTSTPVSYVAGSGEAGSITGGVTTTETGLTGVTKEIVEVDGQKTSEVPQTAGEHTVKVKVIYTKDGVTTSTVETVTVNVSPSTVEGNASYFTNATDKSEIVKKAFEDANNGITINGNITVTKVDGQTASELPSTVKAEGDGTYTVTATATIVKDGASYPNQEITVKVKVVSPATFTSTPVSYVAGSGEAGSITGGVTTTETGLTGVTKEIVEVDGQKTSEVPQTAGEHTVKVKVTYTKDGVTTSTVETVTVNVSPSTVEGNASYFTNATDKSEIVKKAFEDANNGITINGNITVTKVDGQTASELPSTVKAEGDGTYTVTATATIVKDGASYPNQEITVKVKVVSPATFTSTPVSYVAGSGEAGSITGGVTTTETGLTGVTKEIVEVDGQKTSEVPQTAGEHTVKVKVTYTKDGVTTSTVETVTVNVSPSTVEGNASYFTNATDKSEIVKKAFEDANNGITINGNITVTKVDGQTASELPSTVKAEGDGTYTVTATATIVKDGASYPNQEITVKVKVVSPATFTSTPVSYVAGSGEAGSITGGVTTTETGLTGVTKEIVEVDGQKTSEVPQTAGEHTVKVKVIYTKDGVTTSTVETVTVNVSPSTVEGNASYFTNATDKSEIVKKAFEDANNGITINGNITVTKVDGQTASELPSTVKAEGDGTYTVTATATIVKDGASYPNQEITVKVKVVSPATFTSTPVSYVAGSGEAGSITGGVTTTETGLTGVTKEIVEVDGQKTSEVPQTAGEHTVKVKVTYTKDGVTTSTVETVTVNVSPSTVEGNASYFTNATDKSEIVKKAFEDANNGITINGNITVTKVDGQTASELPSTVKAEGDGTYTVTATATIVKDGASYPNQEITVKVKVVSPATFTSTPVSYVAGSGEAGSITGGVTTTETGLTDVTKEIVEVDGQKTSEVPQTAGEHTVKVKVTYTKDGVTTSTVETVTVNVSPAPGAVEVNPPSVIAQDDGSVTITPQGDNADTIKVGFKDNADDTNIPITAKKNEQGKWSLENPFNGVEIDSDTGVITITSGTAKPNTEVTAQAENKTGNKSSVARATVKVSPAPGAVEVNPPSVIAQDDGSVTITPQGDNADTIKVGFKDNADDTSISITANKNDQEKWSLESEFKGVEIDANSGVITINSGVAKAGTEVTAVAEKNGIKSATATAIVKDSKNPVKPPVIEQANGSVTITPQGDVNKIDISFTDKNDKEVQVVAEKNVQGNWNLKNQVDGVSINQDTGVVTLSSGTAKVGSEVKAKESKDGTESGEARVTVIDSNKPVKPGPGPVKPQETNSSDKDERSKRHEKTEKHEVVKKEKVKDNGVRYLDERVKITPVGIDDNNKFVYKRILYIKGYPDNTVRPDNDLTRAEVAMILARLDGLELDDNEYPNFNDTKTDAWYNAAINAVVKKGYMKGYPDSKFYPNKKITRAELANIMVNVYSASGNELKNFSDIKSHWAEDAIKKASESGFVSGYEDGTFKPDKFITRAESVKMFNLLYLYKLSAGNILKIEESKDFKDFKDNEKKDWYYDDIVESTNDYYFTLDNKGVDISDTENEANINHISVSTDDINVIKNGYGSIVRFLNNGSTK